MNYDDFLHSKIQIAPNSDPVVAHFTRRDDSTNEDRVN